MCGSWRAKRELAGGSSWLAATMMRGELRGGSGMGYPGRPSCQGGLTNHKHANNHQLGVKINIFSI